MPWKLSQYVVVTEPFVDAVDGRTERIVFGTRQAQLRLLDEGSWQRLHAGQLDRLSEATVRDLEAAEILVPAGEDELATILRRNTTAAAHHEALYPAAQARRRASGVAVHVRLTSYVRYYPTSFRIKAVAVAGVLYSRPR
jgi:uncharacterized protein